MAQEIKIEWVKCHHGIEKRSPIPCEQCRKEKDELFSKFNKQLYDDSAPTKIAIKRGCPNSPNPCFCTGICNEIIGYRTPLFVGEKQN